MQFLGLVHAGRKERGKTDATVYGIATDSIKFFFYRIDHSGKVSQRAPRLLLILLLSNI